MFFELRVTIRQLLQQQPFRPFRLYLTSNLTYEVRHPELVAVSRSLVRLGFPARDSEDVLAERIVCIALLHIVQYELLPPAGAPTVS